MVSIFKIILKNKTVIAFIILYAVLMISVIRWGIPNLSHPFNYHMDEWHQMQSIRALFTQGSSNVPGAAHGPIFQFFLSGIYIGFFTLLGIIDPFILKSSVTELAIQERLFMLLRLNTLLFGILSLIMLFIIAKKYFKFHPALLILMFALTPVWLSLSNYYKYDIALIFWIITSIFFLLKFGADPIGKNFLLAGIFCSLAVATKISSLPLIVIYIAAFFYFGFGIKKKYSYLVLGIIIFFLIFLIFGIPDILLRKGDYGDFFYSNIILDPKQTDNFILNYPWWAYTIFKILPLNFGYLFFIVYVASIFYFIKQLIFKKLKENISQYKNEIFLLFCLFIFLISLVPLKIGANGNRLLVLLPFLSLLSSSYLNIIWKKVSESSKKLLVLFVFIAILFQINQSFALIYIKWDKDVREISSIWLEKNILSGEKIGIENIPIYQYLPDIIVNEFYVKQSFPESHTKFDYIILDESTKILPDIIILTDREFGVDYQNNSSEKLLESRLRKENYKIMKEFRPHNLLYSIFGNELNMRISGLVPIPTITIYKKT